MNEHTSPEICITKETAAALSGFAARLGKTPSEFAEFLLSSDLKSLQEPGEFEQLQQVFFPDTIS